MNLKVKTDENLNITILECKDADDNNHSWQGFNLNITRLECKADDVTAKRWHVVHLNITRLECKIKTDLQ